MFLCRIATFEILLHNTTLSNRDERLFHNPDSCTRIDQYICHLKMFFITTQIVGIHPFLHKTKSTACLNQRMLNSYGTHIYMLMGKSLVKANRLSVISNSIFGCRSCTNVISIGTFLVQFITQRFHSEAYEM